MSIVENLIPELKRRRVFRTAGIYIVGAWVVLQVADLAFASWGLPGEALQFVWIALFVLFPVALLVGWRYDVTIKGIVRTPDDVAGEHGALTAIDYGVLTLIVAIVTVGGYTVYTRVTDFNVSGSTDALITADIDPHSIAVLPFSTRSNIEDTVFFADGVHDDLLTTLSNISALKVISRTSVLNYRDTSKNMRDIGRELGAANILEGAVQRAGDKVRINVQLINAETDEHLWAQIYDRELTIHNLFAIQTEIAETIAAQLATTLSAAERARIRRDRTDNLEAFNAYIRGKHLLSRSSFQALNDAVSQFRKAVDIDPEYVLARVGLARAYSDLAATGAITPAVMLENGREHIDRAIELDPENGYALAVLALYDNQANAGNVEELMLRALELSPHDVDVLDIYSDFLRSRRRNAEALVYIQRALELDPVSVPLYHDLGRTSLGLGLFDEANAAFSRIAQIDPDNPYAAHGLALATILSGRLAEAGHWSDLAAKSDPLDYENPATGVIIYLSAGYPETAKERLDAALELGPNEPYPLSSEAYYLTLMGEPKKALNIARTALTKQLEDRWGSQRIFLRILRDDAIASGNYGEALAWYQQLIPQVFGATPTISAGNISKAADAAHLLLLSGAQSDADAILNAVVEKYDEEYALGSANFPLGIAKVDALSLLGNKDQAISVLQELVDDGWRVSWQWDTAFNRNHDALRDSEQYQAIVSWIEADLAAQRSAFAAMTL